jgi:hypothetical protein
MKGLIQQKLVNPKSKFYIVSYWWGRGNINKNSHDLLTYDQLVDRLIGNCKKNRCNYYFVEYPEFAKPGGYQIAINYKATFVKKALNELAPRNVVYIDTDMAIHKYPNLFDLSYDFIGYNWYADPRNVGSRVPAPCYDSFTLQTSGGIMCFGDTVGSRLLLDLWEKGNKKYPGKADDRILSYVFNKLNSIHLLKVLWLPLEYFWIPYFDYEDEFYVKKAYQKWFRKRGIHFDHNYTDYIHFKKFYGIHGRNLFISHPEKLTEEEMASGLGADPDRVPRLWYLWGGKKKRCQTSKTKPDFVNIPKLYVNNSAQVNSLNNLSVIKDVEGFETYLTKIPYHKFNRKGIKIYRKAVINKSPFVVISIVNKSEQDVEYFMTNCRKKNISCVIFKVSRDVGKASVIYTALKKFKQPVIFLDIKYKIERKPKLFYAGNIDFMTINSNYTPVFNKSFLKTDPCFDGRVLKSISSDVLYFNNSKEAIDLLHMWDFTMNTTGYSNDFLALDKAFNKYSFVLFTRCVWLPVEYMIDINLNKILRNSYKNKKFKAIISGNKHYSDISKVVSFFKAREQCGKAPPIIKEGEDLTKEHFAGTKLKDYIYRRQNFENKLIVMK